MAKILLIELQLSAITSDACKKRMDAALAVATKEEATQLRQRAVDIEVHELVVSFWAGTDRLETGARLVKIFGESKPAPSNNVMRLAFGPLAIHLRATDAETRDRFIATLKSRVEAAPHLQPMIDFLTRKP